MAFCWIDRVVDRQYGPAGIAEDDLDALVLERTQQDFRPGQGGGFGHGWVEGKGLAHARIQDRSGAA